MVEKLIKISDTEIFTIIKGQGFPLFVLHGGPGLDHQALGNYFDDLAKDYQLIFIDQRGQGKSKEVDFETLTTKRMATDIVELAEVLGLEEYGIVGHSFGAFVAMQHAVDYPGVAKYIVFIAGTDSATDLLKHLQENRSKLPEKLLERINKAKFDLQNAKTHEEFLRAWGENTAFYFAFPTNEEQLADFNRQVKDVIIRFDILNYCSQRGYGYYDVSNDLHKVINPVLILAGEQDNICSLKGHQRIHSKLKNSKLVIFNTGHMIFVEENTKFLQEIRDFVRET